MPLRDMDRDQMWLLPPTLDELLPLDHPARFVAEFVDALDREGWAELGVEIDGDPMGAPAYHPRALLNVWLYGFMTGVRSCRKLEAACRDQIPYLWLTGWQHPDHNTLWRFYRDHRRAMRKLFERTVRTAVTMKLVDLAVQAVDGTKVGANAAKDRTYSAEELGRLLNRVEKAISDLEAQNEAGEDTPALHLPEELANKSALREQIRHAMDELASEQNRKRINLTDWDARLMKSRHGFVPSYNAQAMVSPLASGGKTTGMLLTAVDVVDQVNDAFQLTPMMEQAEGVTGTRTPLTLADAGYCGGGHLEASHRKGQQVAMPDMARPLDNPYHKDRFTYDEDNDSYICPHGKRLRFSHSTTNKGTPFRAYRPVSASSCRNCPAFGACTKNYQRGRKLEIGPHDRALRDHREWMSTEAARTAYKVRKYLIEPVFGIFKEQLRARRFLLRGLANVKAEWTVLAIAYNLRTLWKAWRTRACLSTQVSTA